MATPQPHKRWAVELRRSNVELEPGPFAALVANRVADAIGVSPVARCPDERLAEVAAGWPAPPDGWADPWLVGVVHEQSATSSDRKARGAWYTPKQLVGGLVRFATADGRPPARIVDPTCGGGAFLLAGLDRLAELGVDPIDAVSRVGGIDLDPVAVQVAEWSVRLWLAAELRAHTATDVDTAMAVTVDVQRGDSLGPWPAAWSGPMLVAGNPPFASPLKRGAVAGVGAERRAERSDLLGPYADIAAVHLLDAVEKAGPGSTVVFVQPQSILSSRDTEPLRAHLDQHAQLCGLWVAREAVFDAGVRACAPVLAVGGSSSTSTVEAVTVAVASGPEVTVRGHRSAQHWGGLAADALGAPTLPPLSGHLGGLARATAGFRDEHYGLVSVCREADDDEVGGDGVETARLVNVGSVDPLTLSWGRESMRFGGRDWKRPIVTRTGLSPRVARWFDAQLGPKVLLATQSKVLEPIVDRAGDLMPATPLIAIHAEPSDLDHIAAVLLAPPVVLWAWRRWFGTALTVDGLKLAARQVGELPLPSDRARWDDAADLVAAASGDDDHEVVTRVGEIMTAAYGAQPDVFQWWFDRLGRGQR